MTELRLVGQPVREQVVLPDIINDMNRIIDNINDYALQRGELGGLDWGMESFNEAFEGLNPGLILVAGQANTGKTALCMQLAWRIAQSNRTKTAQKPHKAYVLYFSLDDNTKDVLPRIVALDQKIEINVVAKPQKYKNTMRAELARRDVGFERLRESILYFKVVDPNYIPMCDSIESIASTIAEHNFVLKEMDEDYRLVVFIDNFHDITSTDARFGSDNEKYNYIASELSRLCTQYDIPIICTAEFRKLNGNRRPTVDDVRESVKIAYEAKAIILCYNEVGIKGEAAQIYWEQEGKPDRRPVLELKVGKNKFSSYKKRMFFEFVPEMSYLREATPEGSRRYNQIIMG